ncbi:hypothetical protein GCAAIG_05675 [Candidatus Electronema halotolerans]
MRHVGEQEREGIIAVLDEVAGNTKLTRRIAAMPETAKKVLYNGSVDNF